MYLKLCLSVNNAQLCQLHFRTNSGSRILAEHTLCVFCGKLQSLPWPEVHTGVPRLFVLNKKQKPVHKQLLLVLVCET